MKSPFYANALQSYMLANGAPPLQTVGGALVLSLHAEDPSGQDDQAFGESPVPRVRIPRRAAVWSPDGTLWRNDLPIAFDAATGEGSAKFWTIGDGAHWFIGGKLADRQPIKTGMLLTIHPHMLTSEEI